MVSYVNKKKVYKYSSTKLKRLEHQYHQYETQLRNEGWFKEVVQIAKKKYFQLKNTEELRLKFLGDKAEVIA